MHPDEVRKPGLTWPSATNLDEPGDRHDRIDYMWCNKEALSSIVAIQLVGEAAETSDIVILPYPTDHRAILATVALSS